MAITARGLELTVVFRVRGTVSKVRSIALDQADDPRSLLRRIFQAFEPLWQSDVKFISPRWTPCHGCHSVRPQGLGFRV